MNIKRIKKLKVSAVIFDVVWDTKIYGGHFSYGTHVLTIGLKDKQVNYEK